MSSILNATTSSGLVTSADNSGSLQLATNNGTTAVTIDTSQNVGIGTTSPSSYYKPNVVINNSNSTGLSIIDTSTTLGMIAFGFGSTGTLGGNSNRGKFWYDLAGDSFNWNTSGTGSLTPQMRIDSSGNLLVGKTSYSSTVNGFQFGPADNGANIGLLSITGNSTNSGATAYQLYSTSNSTFRFYVNYAGTIFAQSTTITGISDQRLKENIVDLPDGLNAVMALKPRKFDWKEGKGKDIKGDRGFIAQEFETVFPDMIEEWKDPAPEGEEPYKAVNANLIPTLVKAIQELNAKVEAQAVRIAELEGAK